MKKIKLSIIVCAYNEENSIKKCIEKLINQVIDYNNIEINQNFIRDGEWKNGQFIKGTYSISYFVKYVGSFIDGKDGDSQGRLFIG